MVKKIKILKGSEEVWENLRISFLNSSMRKSNRRIFFTSQHTSTKDRGYYYADDFYGMGSGVLIRFKKKFFLLTAKHVIENNKGLDSSNESPFWITAKYNQTWTSLYDFLFPCKQWHIGNLLKYDKCSFVDTEDLVLIELFSPAPLHLPDYFIDLDKNKNIFLKQSLYREGLYLTANGYPHKSNGYNYLENYGEEDTEGVLTHYTCVHLQTILGLYKLNQGGRDGFISFYEKGFLENNVGHDDLNGMSGGLVSNYELVSGKIKCAGILVTGGENIARFIPSYLLKKAILNYEKSPCKIIDPIVHNYGDEEYKRKSLDSFADYLMNYVPTFKKAAKEMGKSEWKFEDLMKFICEKPIRFD